VRFLTDPTFDSTGGDYKSGPVTLHKLSGPAPPAEELGNADYVLISHDQHFDNLDHAGRAYLPSVQKMITTSERRRKGRRNSGELTDWQSSDLSTAAGKLRVVATPSRHGAAGLKLGAVTGFVLFNVDSPKRVIDISGDTVLFEGVAEVAKLARLFQTTT